MSNYTRPVEGTEQADRPIYTIGAIARMLGVTTTTLRNWEERYALVVPHRSPGGQRLYSREQLEQLRLVAGEVQRGLQPAEAHRLLAESLREGRPPRAQPADTSESVILVVEPDPHTAELIEFFLRSEGYQIEVVADAASAERRAAEISPRLVVLELLVQGSPGVLPLKRLRELTGAPVICISSLSASGDAAELGAEAFLRKPLDPTAFIDTVRRLLSRGVSV